jgi:hypothetical protein
MRAFLFVASMVGAMPALSVCYLIHHTLRSDGHVDYVGRISLESAIYSRLATTLHEDEWQVKTRQLVK